MSTEKTSKYAVVTGASSGIGLEFARLLAEDGYSLLLVSRTRKELENVAADLHSEYGAKSDILPLDLSSIESVETLWEKVRDKQIDVLINNAGFGDLHSVVDADWEKLYAMIELNISTLTRLSQLAAIHMKNNGSGKILNVASIAAFFPGPGMATYYATKAYVLSFSEALSEELKNTGVTVTALCPGPTKTHFSETAGADKSGLFSGNIPTANDVAVYGYNSMKAGKVVAVHGLKNKATALLFPRIAPRSIMRAAVNKMQNK